jgi:actin-related protein
VIVDLGCVEGRLVCFFNGAICEDTLQIVPIGFQSLLDKINKSKEAMNSNSNTDNDEGMVSVKDIDAVNEMYFDLENPNSLIYAFFSSLIKCPIDLRKKVVQRIIFVGGGVEGISQFEQRFVQCVKGLFELDSDADASGDGDGRTLYRVKDDGHRRFSSLANVVMKAPLGVLYPLQFRPSCVSWVGGSIMGSIKLSDEKWINRSEQQSS